MKKALPVKRYIFILSGVLILGGLIAYALYALKPQLPPNLHKKINFLVYYPDATTWKADENTLKYDEKSKVFSYVTMHGSDKVTVSEQATPDIFNDVPEYYGKVLDGYRMYKSFDSSIGKANLTQPPEYKGGQTAILSSRGTLMFAKPEHNLSDDEWKQFFDSMEVIR